MLSKEIFENYLKAGKIAAETRNEIHSVIKAGVPLLQICEKVENTIKQKGGKLAFPCNICVNEVAAHYSSPPGDTKIIPNNSIVKIDLGVHVDGYIADTAFTVSLNPEFDSMVFAVNESLKQAINTIRPGIKTDKIGQVVQEAIEKYGFKPIWNLTGHQLGRYILHTGKSIPSVPKFGFAKINVDEVFAIEPFLTLSSGAGEVRSAEASYIFRLQKEKDVHGLYAKKTIELIKSRCQSLPFSRRWLSGVLSEKEMDEAFRELLATRCVMAYPVLVEGSGKIVAQAEHTIIVTTDGCQITTL